MYALKYTSGSVETFHQNGGKPFSAIDGFTNHVRCILTFLKLYNKKNAHEFILT